MSKIRKGIKMGVNPEQSRKVQEICFENDISWYSGKILKHLNQPFLYINKCDKLGYSDISDSCFYDDKNEEVSAELFIRTNGTCVESETTTEDNSKGEQMEELKLECLVEGYEGTYFEIGQIWETRNGEKIVLKDIIKDAPYPLLFDIGNTNYESFTLRGTFYEDVEYRLDLVKLISTEVPTESTPTEEPQPKTLSEYLKENNAYESFVENCVEDFLNDIDVYNKINEVSEKGLIIGLKGAFIWEDTKEGIDYWYTLAINQPENLIYDMNEIIFKEVDKRIAEQKPTTEFITTEDFDQMLQQKASTKYMVFVEGKNRPNKIHNSFNSAKKEAKRLSAEEIGCNVMVLSVVKTFKSKVIVEEVK